MEQPPKIPENDEGKGDEIEKEEELHIPEEPLEKAEGSYETSVPEEDTERIEREKEKIRERLEQGSQDDSKEEGPEMDEKSLKNPPEEEEKKGKESETYRRGVASTRPSRIRGFFGLIFMWFFNGIKKSFGGKVEAGHGGGGGAKKPSGGHGGGHGGGGHH